MIGIYKITNKVNGHSYVGQSSNIQRRWQNHKVAAYNLNDKGYEYPLYRAMRKYGQKVFSFEVLEECSQAALNEREIWWINQLQPEYNQTVGGDYQITGNKLTPSQVDEIKKILISDIEGKIQHKDLATKYGVCKDTIRDINVGRTWFDEKLSYPLHYSKFDPRNPNKARNYCCDCGIEISKGSNRCIKCDGLYRRKELPLTREELKNLIRTTPFTKIGKMFNVTDNSVRKWCDKCNLPRKASEIKKINDQDWLLL